MGDQTEESEWFSGAEAKLATAFLEEGYDRLEAQELGFLVAQAVRNVPPLLKLLGKGDDGTSDEILDAVHAVLSNRHSLNEAARKLLPEKQA